ncbi:MAG: hypothetical protein OER88_08315, partial [Planctomycetota bacterium]|nr:hypothetical protein [Planctomycetota bacterium]
MRKKTLFILFLFVLATPLLAADAPTPVVADDEVFATCPQESNVDTPVLDEAVQGKGGGKPKPGDACCDPALEPGQNGNPWCFEGHRCCDDGSWGCNNPDGSASCATGDVCDGSCASNGASCSSNGDCCS